MQKTDSEKKTVVVIDEYGNKLESTYPKRAKGLVKSGRARYVDENTILLLTVLPINKNLEEKNMNNNEIKTNVVEEPKTITMEYIINKIDEIIIMNRATLIRDDLAEFSNVPGTKNPIQSICETNNKMIDLLKEMLNSVVNKKTNEEVILEGYMKILSEAMGDFNADHENVATLVEAINTYKNSNK